MTSTISAAFVVWIFAASLAAAAAIPAGTLLVGRTTEPVSSHARIGTPFKAELEHAVVIKGKVVLPAGTRLLGVVDASLGTRPVSDALRVNLKAILVNGRSIPVRTTGDFRLDRHKTSRGVSVSGREWNFPYRTRMVFHLAQPVSL
jgi:hypothetical protein